MRQTRSQSSRLNGHRHRSSGSDNLERAVAFGIARFPCTLHSPALAVSFRPDQRAFTGGRARVAQRRRKPQYTEESSPPAVSRSGPAAHRSARALMCRPPLNSVNRLRCRSATGGLASAKSRVSSGRFRWKCSVSFARFPSQRQSFFDARRRCVETDIHPQTSSIHCTRPGMPVENSAVRAQFQLCKHSPKQ